MDLLCFFFLSCVCYAFVRVICWERAVLLALVCDVYCVFVTFPCGILCQVWHLIVWIPDLCRLSYFFIFLVFLNVFTAVEGIRWGSVYKRKNGVY